MEKSKEHVFLEGRQDNTENIVLSIQGSPCIVGVLCSRETFDHLVVHSNKRRILNKEENEEKKHQKIKLIFKPLPSPSIPLVI